MPFGIPLGLPLHVVPAWTVDLRYDVYTQLCCVLVWYFTIMRIIRTGTLKKKQPQPLAASMSTPAAKRRRVDDGSSSKPVRFTFDSAAAPPSITSADVKSAVASGEAGTNSSAAGAPLPPPR